MKDLFKDTLTLDDARKITGPRAFNIMLKPAGSLCNLDCAYCYYLDKAEIYGGREPRMSIGGLRSGSLPFSQGHRQPLHAVHAGGRACKMHV